MYPECRHVLASGGTCDSPALAKSAWCYFHTRLHYRQGERQAARHSLRRPDGRFAALPAPDGSSIQTIDYGPYPVGDPRVPHPERSEGWDKTEAGPWENTPLELPPVEDTVSIQLALIDVLQALAANQLDPKRAGLLLYGLQVASSNAKNVFIHSSAIRSITYTDDGIPLAPQDYGWDIEDMDDDEEDDDDQHDDEDERDEE
jgi:hypothetical protein